MVRSQQKFRKGRKVTHSPDTTWWVPGRDVSAEPVWQAHRKVPTATDRTGRRFGAASEHGPGFQLKSSKDRAFAFCCPHLPGSCVRRYACLLACPFVRQKQKLPKPRPETAGRQEQRGWGSRVERNFQGLAGYADKVQLGTLCVFTLIFRVWISTFLWVSKICL